MTDVATGSAEQDASTEAQTSGLDFSPILSRFDEQGARFDSMEARFDALTAEPDTETDDGFDFASLYGEDPEQGQEAERQLNPEALQSLIDARIQAGIDAAVNPLGETVRGLKMSHEAAALVSEYPDMDNPDVFNPVVKEAEQRAQAMGLPPGTELNMQFLKTIYEAQMARKYAAGEVPVGGQQGFEAERGGGAGPTADEAPNIAQQVIASRQKRDYWNDL